MRSIHNISDGHWGEEVFSKLSWFKADVVRNAKVMVVGCGALGNEVLKNLVLFGIGHIVIVDFDVIEESNLCRSVLFRKSDAEKHCFKTDVAAKRLQEINPAVKIDTIHGDISYNVGLGLLKEMDVIISCLDNQYARYTLCRSAFRVGVPWVDGGIDGLEGTARVFRHGENCYACNLGEKGIKEMSQRMSCSSIVRQNQVAGRVPTTPVVASIIAAVQVQEAMKLIHTEELADGRFTSLCGKMFYWEGEHLSSKIVEFKAYDDTCPLHEKWDDVVCADLSSDVTVDEALRVLASVTGSEEVRILLGHRSFVEYILSKDDRYKIEVMRPNFEVPLFIEQNNVLDHVPYGAMSSMYQLEHKVIDKNFRFKHLTLKSIGIPDWDIIEVDTPTGIKHIELSNDAKLFNTFCK
ncbi:HesA/MoeB/ThiF family protein [Parabacteroides sp.]